MKISKIPKNTYTDKKSIPLILASSSPRRLSLLRKAGYDPKVIPSDIDESVYPGMEPKYVVMFLSLKKALYVREAIRGKLLEEERPLIIAADTVVYKDKVLGKPRGRAEALSMLMSISGSSHDVYSGVTVIDTAEASIETFFDKTEVFCKSYSVLDLIEYLATDEPFDKAGGYAIQGWFKRYIDHIDGDYDNVVGLPMKQLENTIALKRPISI